MSNTILILGESGTGKSTSMRNLNPETTFIINVLDKPLPFRGYQRMYSKDKKNYAATDSYIKIIEWVRAVNERRPDIQCIIIDDFNFVMANEFMHRASERGYDRFTDIGKHTFALLEELKTLRPDLYCFIMSHTEQNHAGQIKSKTVGKVVDDKVSIEGRVSVVLHTQIVDGNYKFLTQTDGLHAAKSPLGMFYGQYIDNDLQFVLDKMIPYFSGDDEFNNSGENND